MPRPIVFIGYSHKDEEEKDQLLAHLDTLEIADDLLIEAWRDDRIGIGDDRASRISEVIAQAGVAILLISPNFLISDYILQKEISELFKHRKSERLIVFAVLAKSCAWEKINWLAKMNIRPKSGKPIWDNAGSNADEDLTAIVQEVAVIIKDDANDGLDQDRILVLTSDGLTQTVPLTAQGLTIGRNSDNDLVLDYPNVSRYHARVEFGEINYRIVDLGSANGTYLANVKLVPSKPTVWVPGQLLRIGSNQLMLRQQSHAEPEPMEQVSPPDHLLPDQPTHFSIRFKLQLSRQGGLKFKVRAIETPMGEPHALSQLPYTAVEIAAILKALRMPTYEADRFRPEENDVLKRLGLLFNSHFVSDLANRIGRELYDALITGDVNTAFQMALNKARTTSGIVSLQLRFDEDAIELARYPWELLYHRRALLPSRAVELTRYISYPEAVTALPVTPPLRLLYIQSRPSDLPTLPGGSEQMRVRQALDKLAAENILSVDVLSQPTYEALLDYLEADTAKTVHLLHFDGHGVFARRCLTCGAMNYPHSSHCQAKHDGKICGQEITGIEPQGYLAFEHVARGVDWIKSETLGNLLYKSPIRLAVLSACRSSSVGGEVLFGGIAPALIQAGIPAVVATQLPISTDVAVKFMQGFYRALARFESVPAAINAGRVRVMRTSEWFIPTLYLRSRDDEGYLLKQT